MYISDRYFSRGSRVYSVSLTESEYRLFSEFQKEFATYGVNNNFTSVSYSPGSIQANPAATTMTSTGKSYRPPRSLDSYANKVSQKGILSHVALPRPTPSLSYADKYLQKGIHSKVPLGTGIAKMGQGITGVGKNIGMTGALMQTPRQ